MRRSLRWRDTAVQPDIFSVGKVYWNKGTSINISYEEKAMQGEILRVFFSPRYS